MAESNYMAHSQEEMVYHKLHFLISSLKLSHCGGPVLVVARWLLLGSCCYSTAAQVREPRFGSQ